MAAHIASSAFLTLCLAVADTGGQRLRMSRHKPRMPELRTLGAVSRDTPSAYDRPLWRIHDILHIQLRGADAAPFRLHLRLYPLCLPERHAWASGRIHSCPAESMTDSPHFIIQSGRPAEAILPHSAIPHMALSTYRYIHSQRCRWQFIKNCRRHLRYVDTNMLKTACSGLALPVSQAYPDTCSDKHSYLSARHVIILLRSPRIESRQP